MIGVTRSLLMVMVGIGAASPFLSAASPKGHPGAVFVMTNDANKNEVIAYERDSEGNLSNEVRYDTGGRGSGGITDPLESQGSLTLSQDDSVLFAVNAGSGNVSVFDVRNKHGDTGLWLLSKTPSGGSQPVAVAEHQNLVYVLNSGGAGSVVGFHLGFGGQLERIKNSTQFLTATTTGGASIAFSPDGRFLAVTERIANNIDTFRVNSDGTLQPIVVNANPAPGTFSLAFAPGGQAIVSETGVAGAVNGSAISSYSIANNGKVVPISHSIAAFASGNCWNAITPNGKYVYTSNSGSDSISGYAIGAGGVLTPIGATVVGTNPTGSHNVDIAVSADGKNVYTINSVSGTIGVFQIQSDGTLTNLGEEGDLPKSVGFNGIAAL
jgi:6-phosphogluconolactonase